MTEMLERISDDLLDSVTGGAGNVPNLSQLNRAGVIVKNEPGGNVTYQVKYSNGRVETISQSVATGMVECYKIGGGTKLSDQQIRDLIQQS